MFDLDTVKMHLRIDHAFEDSLITGYMTAAQSFCETFLGKSLETFEEMPGTILAGLLLHTALLYEDREGQFTEKNLGAVRLLYYPHRVVPV